MKKSLRFCVLLALAATLLTVSAFADTGPKPQLTVKVTNPPEELYYLDLLAEGDWEHAGNADYSGLDWSYSEEEIAAWTAVCWTPSGPPCRMAGTPARQRAATVPPCGATCWERTPETAPGSTPLGTWGCRTPTGSSW